LIGSINNFDKKNVRKKNEHCIITAKSMVGLIVGGKFSILLQNMDESPELFIPSCPSAKAQTAKDIDLKLQHC